MNNQKGVSLYISIVIMAIILSIVLGVGSILLGQLRLVRGIEHSVIAFYAAEAGIEKVLVSRVNPLSLHNTSGTLSNGATYDIEAYASGGSCGATNFCIRSKGVYQGAQRTIQVTY